MTCLLKDLVKINVQASPIRIASLTLKLFCVRYVTSTERTLYRVEPGLKRPVADFDFRIFKKMRTVSTRRSLQNSLTIAAVLLTCIVLLYG